LRIIQSFWSKNGYSIDDRPEIIGSLYQLGLFYPSGKVREPHFNPRPNEFGEKVKESIELFNSFKNRNNVFFYKKKVIMKNRILVLLLSLLFVSCDILSPEESLPFPWVKRDTELIYNYYSNTDTIFSALSIKFLLNPDNNLRMVYDYNNGYNNGLLNSSIGNSFLIFKENDGLYASTPISCIPPSFKSTKFLRVPSKPKLNKLYPQYVCGDIGFSLEVIGIDTVITVPSGSYNVFLLNDMSHSIIEYWSEKHGLIRMLCFNKNDSTYFAYELISIKY